MATAAERFRLVHDQLHLYEQHSEAWKDDHDAAMVCRDFEELLAFGIFVFDAISRMDDDWHSKALKKASHDAELEELFVTFYRKWLHFSDALLPHLERLEKSFEVERAHEFRRYVRQARAIMTDDADFFSDSRLAELRDQAIEEHRSGKTVAIKELSD